MNFQRAIDVDVMQCLMVLRKNLVKIIAALLIGLLIGTGCAFGLEDNWEDQYTASASVYSLVDSSYEDSAIGISAIRAYSYIVKSYSVAQQIADKLEGSDLNAQEIYDMLRIDDQVIQGTTYVYENQASVLTIYADYSDPQVAMMVANTAADVFIKNVNQIFPQDYLRVLDYAYDTEKTFNVVKRFSLYIAAGGIGVTLLAVGALISTVVFAKRVVTTGDCSLYGELDVLGVIPVTHRK